MFYFSVHIANKINPISVVLLLISFTTIYGSNFNSSYGQITLVPDNSLIAQTTDCITSMMTGALIGINSDCTDNIDKINSTSPDATTSISSDKSPDATTSISSDKSPDATTSISSDKSPDATTSISSDKSPDATTSISSDKSPDATTSISSDKSPDATTSISSSSNNNPYNLSKNNPFYHEFQNKNSLPNDDDITKFTPDSTHSINNNYLDTFKSPPQDNPSTFIKSPPQDNPSTFIKSPPQDNPSTDYHQQKISQPISSPYSFQSLHTAINKNTYANSNHDDLGNALEGKNKHSKEISECFDRAFSIDNYLSDSEIIECAKDRDSFSQNSINSYALSEKIVNNNDKNSDGKTDNKHSKEISECFDRAFSIDNYLSDSEIIECAKDRDSFK